MAHSSNRVGLTVLALFIAAFVGTLPFVVLTTIVAAVREFYQVQTTLMAWGATSLVALIGNFTLGVALHEHAREKNRREWGQYLLAGTLWGACTGAALGAVISVFNPSYFLINVGAWSFVVATYGVLATSIFWLIRRPDRGVPANPPTSAP